VERERVEEREEGARKTQSPEQKEKEEVEQ
jgi:hypothetical protein